MAFYRPDYVKIKNAFTSKKEDAKAAAEERRRILCAEIPELASICRQLAATGPRIYEAAVNPEGDLEGKLAAIRKENESLLAREKQILADHGYPEDWLDVKYECPICSDEGNIGGVMCECMKKRLIEAGYETAGIAGLAATHGFETFDLSYYEYDRSVYANMKYVFERAEAYADAFSVGQSPSLLFLGGTGSARRISPSRSQNASSNCRITSFTAPRRTYSAILSVKSSADRSPIRTSG